MHIDSTNKQGRRGQEDQDKRGGSLARSFVVLGSTAIRIAVVGEVAEAWMRTAEARLAPVAHKRRCKGEGGCSRMGVVRGMDHISDCEWYSACFRGNTSAAALVMPPSEHVAVS